MTKRQAIRKAQELAAATGRDMVVAVGQRRSYVYPRGDANGSIVVRPDGSVRDEIALSTGI